MKKIIIADCETDPFLHGRVPVPFLWGVYDGVNYEQFEKTEDFIRYITDIDCICYAHNGGKFDWHFITEFIDYGTELLIINGRLSRFTIGECQFRDSYNILPVPLAQMQKTKIDYAIFEKAERVKPYNKKLIEDYLYDDCRFLFDYVMAFIDRYGLHLTQATASLKTWEKMCKRKAPHDVGGELYEKFSSYYYGGRCQAFTQGQVSTRCEMVDINSAYPYAMLSHHPMSLLHVQITDLCAHDWQGHNFLIVRGCARGALPYRATDNSLSFPFDNEVRDFHITGWEWLALHETGYGAGYEIIQGWEFLEVDDFKKFIIPLYDERLNAKAVNDSVTDLLAKLCMNSCYGKFGSNPSNYECYKVLDPSDIREDAGVVGRPAGDGWAFAGYFGELALVSRPLHGDAERYYNVATSASITGYVRAMLWRAICKCEGVLYCDTDSIVARDTSKLPGGDGLGAWKLEAVFSKGAIGGKKLYAFEYENPIKKKGCESSLTHKTASKGAILTAAEIMQEVCQGSPVIYKPKAPTFSVRKKPNFTSRTIRMTKQK